jgi:hypothetical protein
MNGDTGATGDPEVCGSCGQPGSLVRARRLLQTVELADNASMLGRDARFHRSHVPLGWRVVDFDPDVEEGLPPDVPTV